MLRGRNNPSSIASGGFNAAMYRDLRNQGAAGSRKLNRRTWGQVTTSTRPSSPRMKRPFFADSTWSRVGIEYITVSETSTANGSNGDAFKSFSTCSLITPEDTVWDLEKQAGAQLGREAFPDAARHMLMFSFGERFVQTA